MNDCLFCKIINGDIPSAKVYEDQHSYAFLDIKPINAGHTLLVPKKHFANLYEMPDDVLANLTPTIKKLAIAIKKSVGADGINIGMNNDSAAGQLVFHAHIHIMPRFKNDGHEHWHGKPYQDGEIDNVAQKIKANL
ncbi:MAG: HIT family protein [bacterium]|nr:HIT family protein [bacterium]